MRIALLSILIPALLVATVLTGITLTRRDRVKSVYLTVLCAGVWLYLFGYILEISTNSLEGSLVALKIENAGIPLFGPFLLLFVLSVCRPGYLKPWAGWVAAAYCILLSGTILLNEFHHLYYADVQLQSYSDFSYFVLSYGPLYVLQQLVVLTCTVFVYVTLFRRMSLWTTKARRQLRFITIGILLPTLANVLHFTRLIPPQIDPTPVAMTITLVFSVWSILHYRLFDIVPIASETVIDTMEDAVVVLDQDWCYQYSNQAALRIFTGLGALNRTEPITILTDWPPQLQEPPEGVEVDFEREFPAGVRYYRARVSQVNQEGAPIGWSIAVRDITETATLLSRLQEMATTDYLTGICNRRHFMDQAQKGLGMARRESLPSSIIMFDLDHFKRINDSYGHQAGDHTLIKVAGAVRAELRFYDIFARYGGEEFILYSVGIDQRDALGLAHRLAKTIQNLKISWRGHALPITASFGLVELAQETTLEEAIFAADQAMYGAKERGRNQVVVGNLPVTRGKD